jgi:hypothetical protein
MMIKICDGQIGPEMQKIVSLLRSGPPLPLPQEKLTKRKNQEIKHRKRTVCLLTEAGSKVY